MNNPQRINHYVDMIYLKNCCTLLSNWWVIDENNVSVREGIEIRFDEPELTYVDDIKMISN
jgi:hypothetical protein